MKSRLIILILFVALTADAQRKEINYAAVEKKVRMADAREPALLSRQLTAGLQNDFEKTAAIFRWITEHIEYKFPAKRSRGYDIYSEEEEEDTSALKPLNERVGERVLETKKAFCDGYSRLFKALCDYAGIRSEIIVGYGNGGYVRQRQFKANHSWNAVFIDSSWYLLDVTWASGFVSLNTGQFIKHYDDSYFLSKPENFVRDHFPDELQWTLLEHPPLFREYSFAPFQNKTYNKYSFTSHFPVRGIIEASVGDTVRIVLEKKPETDGRRIAPDYNYDSTLVESRTNWVFVQPDSLSLETRIVYSYPVTSPGAEWLHIMYNNDVVLRYKLNIRKENSSVATR